MADLAAFQDWFCAALRADGDPGPADGVEAGLRVHRNTIAAGQAEALAANFPTVLRLVGDDWFASAARAYAERHPPTRPMLVGYGASFPDFLAAEGTATMPGYLPDVARIDRLWIDAHTAADDPVIGRDALAGLGPSDLFAARPRLHAAVSIAWFETPAVTIWRLNRPPAPTLTRPPTLRWRGEGVATTRPFGKTHVRTLTAGAHALLMAIAGGATLGAAAVAALDAEPDMRVSPAISGLVDAGVFSGLWMDQRR